MTKRPFTSREERAIECLELLYIDVWRPINVQTKRDYKYFITFINDFSNNDLYILCIGSLNLLKYSKNLRLKLKDN